MEFLNRALAQVNDLFRSMTPGSRIATAVLLAVVVISVAYLFNAQISSADAYLMGGEHFSARDLPAMEAAFAKANLSDYQIVGNQIRVPSGQQARYMGALADAGALPANFGDYLMKAISDANPFLTGPQREEMIKAGYQKELANWIQSMDGIERAAVFFNKESKKSGLHQREQTTASVMVKPQGTLPLEEARVPMIRYLVAGAIGMSPQKVTVIDQNSRAYVASENGSNVGGDEDIYLATQKKHQELVENSVRHALFYVPECTVSASVELDKEREHTEESVKIDPQSVAVSVREESKTLNQEKPGPGGRPGLAAQQPNAAAQLTGGIPPVRTDEEQSQSDTQSLVSHNSMRVVRQGLTPTRITVSVGIPDSYYKKIWLSRNPTPAGQQPQEPDPAALTKIETEESTKIKNHIAGQLLVPPELKDATTLVTVTTFTHLSEPPLPEPSMANVALAWLGQYWSTLGMVGLALFSMMVLRSITRGVGGAAATGMPASSPSAMPAEPEYAETDVQQPQTAAASAQPRRRAPSGPTLRDQLTEIVREDPDAAANILRGWISNVS